MTHRSTNNSAGLSAHQKAALLWLYKETLHDRSRYPDPAAQADYRAGWRDAATKNMGERSAHSLQRLGLAVVAETATSRRVPLGRFGRTAGGFRRELSYDVQVSLTPKGERVAAEMSR